MNWQTIRMYDGGPGAPWVVEAHGSTDTGTVVTGRWTRPDKAGGLELLRQLKAGQMPRQEGGKIRLPKFFQRVSQYALAAVAFMAALSTAFLWIEFVVKVITQEGKGMQYLTVAMIWAGLGAAMFIVAALLDYLRKGDDRW